MFREHMLLSYVAALLITFHISSAGEQHIIVVGEQNHSNDSQGLPSALKKLQEDYPSSSSTLNDSSIIKSHSRSSSSSSEDSSNKSYEIPTPPPPYYEDSMSTINNSVGSSRRSSIHPRCESLNDNLYELSKLITDTIAPMFVKIESSVPAHREKTEKKKSKRKRKKSLADSPDIVGQTTTDIAIELSSLNTDLLEKYPELTASQPLDLYSPKPDSDLIATHEEKVADEYKAAQKSRNLLKITMAHMLGLKSRMLLFAGDHSSQLLTIDSIVDQLQKKDIAIAREQQPLKNYLLPTGSELEQQKINSLEAETISELQDELFPSVETPDSLIGVTGQDADGRRKTGWYSLMLADLVQGGENIDQHIQTLKEFGEAASLLECLDLGKKIHGLAKEDLQKRLIAFCDTKAPKQVTPVLHLSPRIKNHREESPIGFPESNVRTPETIMLYCSNQLLRLAASKSLLANADDSSQSISSLEDTYRDRQLAAFKQQLKVISAIMSEPDIETLPLEREWYHTIISNLALALIGTINREQSIITPLCNSRKIKKIAKNNASLKQEMEEFGERNEILLALVRELFAGSSSVQLKVDALEKERAQ